MLISKVLNTTLFSRGGVGRGCGVCGESCGGLGDGGDKGADNDYLGCDSAMEVSGDETGAVVVRESSEVWVVL